MSLERRKRAPNPDPGDEIERKKTHSRSTVCALPFFPWALARDKTDCYDLNQPAWGSVFLVISIGMIFVSSGAFPVVFFALRAGMIRVIMPCFAVSADAMTPGGTTATPATALPRKTDSSGRSGSGRSGSGSGRGRGSGSLCAHGKAGSSRRLGLGSGSAAARGQQSKSVYELRQAADAEIASSKYHSIHDKVWLVFTIAVSAVVVILSALPQVNLKLVLSWGCALFGYPLAFTVSRCCALRSGRRAHTSWKGGERKTTEQSRAEQNGGRTDVLLANPACFYSLA